MGRPSPLRVLLVVEQLRRSVPGGIGRYITGLLQGLTEMAELAESSETPESPKSPEVEAKDVPEVILYASRRPQSGAGGASRYSGAGGASRYRGAGGAGGADPLGAYGFEVMTSALPGPVLTRAWDRGLIDIPGRSDVIHALSLAAPPARHAPLIVTIHDTAWRSHPEAFPDRGRRWHEEAFLRARRRAALLVVPSEQAAADVGRTPAEADGASRAADVTSRAAGNPEIRVIPHGADHLPDPDGDAAGRLLERLGVEGEFLLSVGTVEPRKNLARLFEAYREARPRFPEPWPLVVVGPGGWGQSPPFAEPTGRGGRGGGGRRTEGVVATGPIDDGTLAGLYQKARLLAYVPLTEGFGFPPVEAMRQGLPVVASPMPSLGGAGRVVDPEKIEEMATALVDVGTDERVRADLVADGLKRTKDLTWLASARAHVAVWESVR